MCLITEADGNNKDVKIAFLLKNLMFDKINHYMTMDLLAACHGRTFDLEKIIKWVV